MQGAEASLVTNCSHLLSPNEVPNTGIGLLLTKLLTKTVKVLIERPQSLKTIPTQFIEHGKVELVPI